MQKQVLLTFEVSNNHFYIEYVSFVSVSKIRVSKILFFQNKNGLTAPLYILLDHKAFTQR